MRKTLSYLVYILLCILGIAPNLQAQSFQFDNSEYSAQVLTANNVKTGAVNNNTVAAEHTLWELMTPGAPGNAVGHINVKEIRCFVKLKINHEDPNVYVPYTYRVNYKLTGYTTPGNDGVYQEIYDTLTVSYNPDSVNAYQDVHMRNVYGFYKAKLQILDIYDFTCKYDPTPCSTPPSGFIASSTLSSMADNWSIELGFARHVFDVDVPSGLGGWVSGMVQNVNMQINSTPPATGDNFLKINWTANLGGGIEPQPSMYELEWTFVDNSKVSFSYSSMNGFATFSKRPLNQLNYNFTNNATRIITSKTEYRIPLIFKMGYIVYRVRLLRPESTTFKYTAYGPWSLPEAGSMNSINAKDYYEVKENNVHQGDQKNWNYQASYAEEGKSKHILSYFDGLLKSRQTVTKFNSLPNQQIVFEQFYNYEGKVGLQTLPVPVSSTALTYQPNFALNSNSGQPYKAPDFDNKVFAPLNPIGNSSAGRSYYSPDNFLYNPASPYSFLRSLPDAHGYPLIQTKLATEDGRVLVQGGAGEELQIGKGHETRNYYMPPSENDLNKYFGINSGKFEFYEKTITRDPNKQLSFAINNNEGKIVMSGLMGFPPSSASSPLVMPDGVTVPTNSSYPKEDLLFGTTPNWSGSTKTYNKSFFQEKSGNTKFNYGLSLAPFSPCGGSYMNIPLKYDLNVYDEYGVNHPLLSATTGSVNITNTPVSVPGTPVNVTLDIGKHTLDYQVSYNPADVELAVNNLLAISPTCLKTQNDFLKTELDNIDMNCDEGDGTQTQCRQYEELLRGELYPTGKYAKYQDHEGDITYIDGHRNSILTIMGWGDVNTATAYSLISGYGGNEYPVYTVAPGSKPIYRFQVFLAKRYTQPAQLQQQVGNTGYTIQQLIEMKDLDIRKFLFIFNDDIAELLLPMHPEYCKFMRMYCDNTDFEARLSAITTYAEAESQGLHTLNLIALADDFGRATGMGGSATVASGFLKNKVAYYPDAPPGQEWYDNRLDHHAFCKLVCEGETDDYWFNQVRSWQEADLATRVANATPAFRDEYIKALIHDYISNRQTRIAHYPVEDGQGVAVSCTAAPAETILGQIEPKVIRYAYSATGKMDHEVDGLDATNTATLNTLFTSSSASGVPTVQSVAQDAGYLEYANEIVRRLSNCIKTDQSGVDFVSLGGRIYAYLQSAIPNKDANWKGGLTPAVLNTILGLENVKVDDLCNPYLVDYIPDYDPNKACKDEQFYANVANLINTIAVNNGNWANLIDNGTLSGTLDHSTWSNNVFYKELLGSLYTSTYQGSYQVKYNISYSFGSRFNFFFYTGTLSSFGNDNCVRISLQKTNAEVFYANHAAGFQLACISGISGKNFLPIEAMAKAPQVIGDGPGTGKPERNYTFNASIRGLIEIAQLLSPCISCMEMKRDYDNFVAAVMNGYEIRGKGHPFFEDALRSYFNFQFKKTHSSQQYLDFMEGCNMAEYFKIPSYYGYLHVKIPGAPNTNYTDAIDQYFRTTDNGAYANYTHFYYLNDNPPPGSSHLLADINLYVDFRFFPKEKIRSILNGLNTVLSGLSAPAGTVTTYNELEGGNSNSTNFADLFVQHIPGAADFNPSGGGIAPASLNWNTNMCPLINDCQGTAARVSVIDELIKVKDNNRLFPFRRFHFDVTNAASAPSLLSYLTYKYNNNILPDASRNFITFSQYHTTLNSDNLESAKIEYLKYVYNIGITTPRTEILNALLPQQLKTNIVTPAYAVNYNGYPYVSYFNGDKGISGDLFLKPSGVTDAGLTEVSNILTAVKNSGGGNSYFSAANTFNYSGEDLSVSGLADNRVWYNLKNTTTRLHRNIWIDLPGSIPAAAFGSYTIVSSEIIPAAAQVRRFKLIIRKGSGPDLEAYGRTDFDLTSQPIRVYENVLLCDNDSDPVDSGITCYEQQVAAANANARLLYDQYMDGVRKDFTNGFHNHIRTQLGETLDMETEQMRYIVTLYGYDRAGNLNYTVPPEGVRTVADGDLPLVRNYLYNAGSLNAAMRALITPDHKKVSRYNYNSLNQVHTEISPDAGTAYHFYDKAGRKLFSQTAKQSQAGRCSYFLYDEQSRMIETGEVGSASMYIAAALNDVRYHTYSLSYATLAQYITNTSRTDVVHTFYDEEITDLATKTGMTKQQNLRNRVATVAKYASIGGGQPAGPASVFTVALHYSYDLSGNVQTLTYDMPVLDEVKQRYKRVDYDYDLYSGKVTLVSYNRSFADQYYQRYEYDDDNRITKVETSKDGLLWDRDAEYKYYPHGPLARVSLGDLQVQGIDFAYTLQGWLKSINGDTPEPGHDMGGDGVAGGNGYQKDLLKSTLYYYNNDYKPIIETNVSNTGGTTMMKIPDLDLSKSLYNGNIAASMSVPGYFPSLYTNYTYDQLNRIKQADYKMVDYATSGSGMLKGLTDPTYNGTVAPGQGGFSPNDFYKSSYTYDFDGNLKTLQRYALSRAFNTPGYQNAQVFRMDDLQYRYDAFVPNNKLMDFTDAANHANTLNDLKYYTSNGTRFTYDASGNLTQDLSNDIENIKWDPYGKTSEILFHTNGKMLKFDYDAMNMRYLKSMLDKTTNTTDNEYYIRDAGGNILAVYKQRKKYSLGRVYPPYLEQKKTLLKLSEDVLTVVGKDNAFEKALLVSMQEQNPGYVTAKLADKLPSYYLERSPGLQDLLMDFSQNFIPDMLNSDNGDFFNNITSQFNPTFFEPLIAETAPDLRDHMFRLLTDAADTPAMRAILTDLGSSVIPSNQDEFVLILNEHIGLMDPDAVMTALRNNLTGSRLNITMHRMLSDDTYLQTEHGDWPYRTVDAYVRKLLAPSRMSTEALGTYYDEQYTNNAEWRIKFDELYDNESRLAVVYKDNPVALLDGMKESPAYVEVLSQGLEGSPSISLEGLITSLTKQSTEYNASTMEVLDYHKFYLAEHHLYGSSRLGIKSSWPGQYLYEWDRLKSASDNADKLAASEFSYRRVWYSRPYNALINYTQPEPFGNASTSAVYSERILGQKRYELTNHLGNVMSVIADKVTESKANPNDGLPAVANKRAGLAAVYDYYPFGMLMPERYVEDARTQCIPVTHTRYVTKEEEVRTVTAASENLTSYAASPGVRLRFVQGVDVLDPDVALPGNGGPEELGFIQAEQEEEEGSTEMTLSVTSPGTGVDMRLTTYVMNQKSAELRAEDMASGSEGIIVEVRQYVSGVEAPQVLGRQLLWEQASIDIPVKTLGPGDIEISISDLMNRGKFSVGTVQVTRKDVVQDNYVVMTCNTDELGGSDYRFGFNGQQKDNEIRGIGNTLDFKYRGYDARLARFYAVDPLTSKFPWWTPYQFAGNTPIWARELEGLEPWFPRNYILKDLGAWGNNDQATRDWGKKVVVPAAKYIAKEVGKAGLAIVLGHPETSLFVDALLGRLAGEAPVVAVSKAHSSAEAAVAQKVDVRIARQAAQAEQQAIAVSDKFYSTLGESEITSKSGALVGSVKNLDGNLDLWIKTTGTEFEGNGPAVFNALVRHAESKGAVTGINGSWYSGEMSSNLRAFNKAVESGMPLEQAAFETFTGSSARSLGYDKVKIIRTEGAKGNYKSVELNFYR